MSGASAECRSRRLLKLCCWSVLLTMIAGSVPLAWFVVVAVRKATIRGEPGWELRTTEEQAAITSIRQSGGILIVDFLGLGLPITAVSFSEAATDEALAAVGKLGKVDSVDLSGVTFSSTGLSNLAEVAQPENAGASTNHHWQ